DPMTPRRGPADAGNTSLATTLRKDSGPDGDRTPGRWHDPACADRTSSSLVRVRRACRQAERQEHLISVYAPVYARGFLLRPSRHALPVRLSQIRSRSRVLTPDRRFLRGL